MITQDKLKEYASKSQELRDEIDMLALLKSESTKGEDMAGYISELESSISQLQKIVEEQKSEIVDFIGECDDFYTKIILSLRYMRGLLWKEIAIILHKREDSVKRTVYDYFKRIGLK